MTGERGAEVSRSSGTVDSGPQCTHPPAPPTTGVHVHSSSSHQSDIATSSRAHIRRKKNCHLSNVFPWPKQRTQHIDCLQSSTTPPICLRSADGPADEPTGTSSRHSLTHPGFQSSLSLMCVFRLHKSLVRDRDRNRPMPFPLSHKYARTHPSHIPPPVHTKMPKYYQILQSQPLIPYAVSISTIDHV